MTQETLGLAGSPPLVFYGLDKAPQDAGRFDHLPRVPLLPGEALRLNAEAFDLPAPAIGQDIAPGPRLAGHLKHLSGNWSRLGGLFIDGYFAHLQGLIAAHRAEIAARWAAMAGLFAPEDVLYSAPLPLPRALLPLPAEGGGIDHVPVDMFFWLGAGHAKAVLFAPSPLLPAAERRRRERLAAAGLEVRVLAAADLARPGAFADLLGERGNGFWRDEVLPAAPGAPRLPEF
ncbi:hypothetical protein [Ancylobacter oerskovii]|uniref:Uncharacterized protein n=1 Tax=Ancylobacter oerskovii TaxID=459519 RepID=A0ABW4YY03_9HYPH|nr:hypothetical protein [Ancylobacter oerskovii]MBS7541865.1 hypothetical protein [Ancylobacter oerskovii]